jgi:hypothetical protein
LWLHHTQKPPFKFILGTWDLKTNVSNILNGGNLTIFWIVMLCCLKRVQSFAGTYYFHLQLSPDSAGFFLRLLFEPEDADHMFLWNIGLSPIYTVL